MAEIEALFIGETLKVTGGNREEAATMLGIGERTLYRKIKEYGLYGKCDCNEANCKLSEVIAAESQFTC